MPPRTGHARPAPLVNLQFGPHDLAWPAWDGLPAPSITHRLDEHQPSPALVIWADAFGDRRSRDAVPDLDQDAGAVAAEPYDHDRQPGPVIPGLAVGVSRGP